MIENEDAVRGAGGGLGMRDEHAAGAPRADLAREPLDEAARQPMRELVERLGANGERALAVAWATASAVR